MKSPSLFEKNAAKKKEIDTKRERLNARREVLQAEYADLMSTPAISLTDAQDARCHAIGRELDRADREEIAIDQADKDFKSGPKNEELREANRVAQEQPEKARVEIRKRLFDPSVGYLDVEEGEFGGITNEFVLRHPLYRQAYAAAEDASNAVDMNARAIRALDDKIAADTAKLESRKSRILAR